MLPRSRERTTGATVIAWDEMRTYQQTRVIGRVPGRVDIWCMAGVWQTWNWRPANGTKSSPSPAPAPTSTSTRWIGASVSSPASSGLPAPVPSGACCPWHTDAGTRPGNTSPTRVCRQIILAHSAKHVAAFLAYRVASHPTPSAAQNNPPPNGAPDTAPRHNPAATCDYASSVSPGVILKRAPIRAGRPH